MFHYYHFQFEDEVVGGRRLLSSYDDTNASISFSGTISWVSGTGSVLPASSSTPSTSSASMLPEFTFLNG